MNCRVAVALALALFLLGCDSSKVPLPTDETDLGGSCWLLHEVVDVIADPDTGTPTIKASGAQLKWPMGFSAQRAGSEVEVLDRDGRVVLTTGGRYEICPTGGSDYSKPVSEWVIGEARACADCDLGRAVD